MANDLVKFPDLGKEWRAVRGPGMYVLAVLPRDLSVDPCTVGCAITLLRPRGRLLNAVELWPTEEARRYDADLLEEAALLFEKNGEDIKAAVLRAQFPVTDLSVEVVQATRMGASMETFRHRDTGEYWQAQWEDLTPAGVLHLHQVNTGFMRPPLLLTFLGDDEGEE